MLDKFGMKRQYPGLITSLNLYVIMFTPQMYRAIANSTTDDTVALDSGKNVYFPESRYKVTSYLMVY
jgi:hypothetical protein